MNSTNESLTLQDERSPVASASDHATIQRSSAPVSVPNTTAHVAGNNLLSQRHVEEGQSQRRVNTTSNNNFGIGGGSQARAGFADTGFDVVGVGTGRRVRSKSQADIVLRRQDFFFTPSPSPSFSLSPSSPQAVLGATSSTVTSVSAPTTVVGQSKPISVTASSTSKRSTSSPQLVLLPRTRSNTGNAGTGTGALTAGKNPSLSATPTASAPFVNSFDSQPIGVLYPPPPHSLTGWHLPSVPSHIAHTGIPHKSAGVPMEQNDSEDDRDDDMIYVSKSSLGVGHSHGHNHSHTHGHSSGHGHGGMRPRKNIVTRRREEEELKLVTTARGQACAGETETELEDVPTRLPIARKIPEHPPLIPLPLDTLVPYLFEFFRLLSIVPAVAGTLYNIHNVVHPPSTISNVQLTAIDYFISALWAILTGLQCLALTTGLLSRWKAYYATLSTLIRLLALQGICWPATHFTLLVFDHVERPLMCWVIIGTTTSFSRSIQLWVTSNLLEGNVKVMRGEVRYGPRRWNWAEVGKKCVLPAGILYFITTWALLVKEELRSRNLL